MSYVLSGIFALIASITSWTYSDGLSYLNAWNNIQNEIEITGTIQVGEDTWSNFTLMQQVKSGTAEIDNVFIYAIITEEGVGEEVQLISYTLDHDTIEISNKYINPNVKKIIFNETQLTQEEYSIVTKLLDMSGDGQIATVYNQGYNQGYQDGLKVGGMNANDQYTAGYNVGKMDGYNKGYDEAMKIADNPYTFRNLLFAVIESPAVFIKSWLNTEVLGINVAGLIFGMFTIAVIIGVGALIKHFI